MKNLFTLLYITITTICSINAQEQNQQILTWNVVANNTLKPLSGTHITVMNKNRFAVTDSNGVFNLDISNLNETDTIKISHTNYQTLLFQVEHLQYLNLNSPISLVEEENILEQMVVEDTYLGKTKIIKKGNKGNHQMVYNLTIDSNFNYKEEIGRKFNYSKNKKGKLKKIKFNYSSSISKDSIPIYISIYNMNNDTPDSKPFYQKECYLFSEKQTDKGNVLELNLNNENIHIKKDFIVTISFIETKKSKEPQDIYIHSCLVCSKHVYYKKKDDQNLEKFPPIMGIGLEVEIEVKK